MLSRARERPSRKSLNAGDAKSPTVRDGWTMRVRQAAPILRLSNLLSSSSRRVRISVALSLLQDRPLWAGLSLGRLSRLRTTRLDGHAGSARKASRRHRKRCLLRAGLLLGLESL